MATIGPMALTLMDWAKRIDDDGKIAQIINLLSQTNEILEDMLWVEGNLPTGHKTTIRTGLPQAYWRLLNQGVPRGKSTTAQITETCGMLETYSDIDVDLLALSGNDGAFRLSEELAFLEGMNQQMAVTVFYNNITSVPAAFMGLAPRYPSVSTATAQTANNVIDALGTGSTNTSMWLIMWGPNAIHGIFPKGRKAGFVQEDMGKTPVYDSNNNPYYAWRTHYKWDAGLVVKDWRFAVRICNIDVTTLSGASPPNLINLMVRAIHRLPIQPARAGNVQTSGQNGEPQLSMGQAGFYCNRAISSWLDIQALNKSNMLLRIDEFAGKPVTSFRGIPIRTCDALLNTEARVV
ncbi:MAG: hypothetical protein M0Z81_04035 [Deltaproteobacteria bacterium]|jgi:hypothetical protein|nr:hypothetical protein [Deltaproteobacteria bacterium]